jgi:type I restriction enzyme, S subunit
VNPHRFPTRPLKRVARISYGLGQPPVLASSGVPIIRATNIFRGRIASEDLIYADPSDLPLARAPLLIEGEVLVVRSGAYTGDSARVTSDWVGALPGYDLRVTPTRVDSRYLSHCFFSAFVQDQIQVAKSRAAQPHLNAEDLGACLIPFPPFERQVVIAAYLDAELGRLDALMTAQTRLIDALEERFSLAQQHLLIGPPTGSDKPGIYQGQLRLGWVATPFRWLFREVDERSETGQERLLSVSQTRGVIRQDELGDRSQRAESYVGYKLCRAGDLVVNRMWVYYGALGVAHEGGLVSPDYSVFRPTRNDVDAELVATTLKTPAFVAEMTMRVRGIGAAFQGAVRKPRLHPKELGEILIPVPTRADRTELIRQLDEVHRRTQDASIKMTRFVELLAERRRALITAAVSGQIDVASEAA